MHFAGKSYTLSLQNKKEGAGMAKQPKKLIANNKKVYHDYFLEETFLKPVSSLLLEPK